MTARSLLLTVVVAAGLVGCVEPQAQVPTNPDQYYNLPRADRERFPAETIVSYNFQRVLDQELPVEKRLESLQLIMRLASLVPGVQVRLAEMLQEHGMTDELREAAMTFLLARDDPGVVQYVAKMLREVEPGTPSHDALLDWLGRHPQPNVLAEVVKIWANEPDPGGPNEPRYRQIVEQITGKYWDESLLIALNSPNFFARGSAMEVLAQRIPLTLIRMWVEGIAAKTEAFAAMKLFLDEMDYLPTTRSELLNTVWVYHSRRERISEAAELAGKWLDQQGYRFNIRDFHLLSRLARHPLGEDMTRAQLIAKLSKSLEASGHVRHQTSQDAREFDYKRQFSKQADLLSLADLWNVYLLGEMLAREQVRAALRIAARRDLADETGAWGGLIFLQRGRAEATLYPSAVADEARRDDRLYRPGRRLVTDSRDALSRFICHFERIKNTSRAGPTRPELLAAAKQNYCGLVLTTLSKTEFCAHYYNPDGNVVSLGTFRFN